MAAAYHEFAEASMHACFYIHAIKDLAGLDAVWETLVRKGVQLTSIGPFGKLVAKSFVDIDSENHKFGRSPNYD